MNIFLIATSFAAGFISALGLGGGGILILFLTLFLNVPQMQAGGINLLFFIPIACISVGIHIKNRLINYKFALKCAPFGVVGALAGVYLVGQFRPEWIAKAFALVILFLGIREIFTKTDPQDK